MIDKTINLQFITYIALILLSAGCSYGILSTRLSQVEANVSSYRTDHELLIRIDAKMDSVGCDLQELKTAIKQHLQKN